MDLYDRLVRNFAEDNQHKTETKTAYSKGKRPLKMPKNYDFKTRKVNWEEYKNDFLLRTDAVWEKQKLKDHFYSMYKNFVYDKKYNCYMVSDIRVVPLPTTESDHLLEWKPFYGYTQNDGCIWTVKPGPKLFGTPSFSHFVCDKEGDAWYSCFIAFQKWMKCNERSPVSIEEAHLFNKGFNDYACFEDLDSLFIQCGPDLFEQMYEMYKQRIMGATDKAPSYTRMQLFKDPMNTTSDRKQLHY